ncbi:uncharacterized protein VICG_00404 [Vittaforma corneae ATCC 50505]|uniref:Uncharacterized protein n=1 Tax=Vittaforma corneae (strain ATCC 50505) TaxID=993615 RepID=L2GQR5_VITCO|nr:uncharacterized protein VICG_00404 [Vittaforma corneae ATCC 50505]ELA42652.1 hypothetical protein VICG_00404 [Vittaforma corneae ATCC 50505]
MVKYDQKNKAFKDFESLLEEIMQCDDGCFEDEVSLDGFEVEISDPSSDSLIKESSKEATTDIEEEDTTEQSSFVPGKIYSFVDGKLGMVDQSEDFPVDNEESEIKLTSEQIKKLTIIDREEYSNTKNIIKPGRGKRKTTRRCENFDE